MANDLPVIGSCSGMGFSGTSSSDVGRWSIVVGRQPFAVDVLTTDCRPTTNDSSHMLNHGVIHTYLMCHNSRNPIFKGSATMVSSKNCMMENCKRLMREKSFPMRRRNKE